MALTGILTGNAASPISASTVTQHGILIGGASNAVSSLSVASTGQILQGNTGADPSFSTSTFPSTATSTGTILRADGTNWVATTSTYPNTNAVSTLLYASSANVMGALATANNGMLVTSATGVPSILAGPGTTGNILQSNSAAAPSFSTATYPSTATGTGTILRADGTNWSATTSTYPNTNAVSTLLYASSANVMAALATANNGTLITSASGVPSWLANGTTGQVLTATTGSPPSWAAASGNVAGPGSSTDRAISTWNGTGGTALFNNSTVKIDSTGRQTNTTQPAFFAYQNAATTNNTGDGTVYTLIFNATRFDQNSNFNTGTGTFTAPVTGRYMLTFYILGQGLVAANTVILQIVTTANTYNFGNTASSLIGNNPSGFTVFASMTANDTATCAYVVSGGTKTVGVFGDATGSRTAFHGYLVC
jgi:hypothetical protein